MREHEYALLGGINRAQVGRYIGTSAAIVSAAVVFVVLNMVDIAESFGIPVNLPPSVLSLIGAGTVFSILYWIFDKYAWRWGKLGRLLKVPDLAGEWNCDGQTINPDGTLGYKWEAVMTIVQTWDKIRVRLKTKQSGSNSITAALVCDEADGFLLLYNYKNDPKIEETQLAAHMGFAQLTFKKDLQTAEGEYFNGYGRYTFGKMSLRRA